MLALHLSKARKDSSNAEVRGFSPVDTGKQRVGEALDHF